MATKLGKIVADFQTALSTKVSVGGTNTNIQSILDDDGEYLPNGQYYFTIDGDNSSKEHIICTLSTPTSLLTNIYSVSRQGVTSEGVAREHRVGATVTITDFAHIKAVNDLLDGSASFNSATPLTYDAAPTFNADQQIITKKHADDTFVPLTGDKTIAGVKTFSSLPTIPETPVADTDAASKGYVDGVAISGAPDATATVKGIGKYASAAEIVAGTEVSAVDGTPLVVNPKYLQDAGIVPVVMPSCLTMIPRANFLTSESTVQDSTTVSTIATNTTLKVGQVVFPMAITVNKITFIVSTKNADGTFKIAVYSEDGATKELEHTTATVDSTGYKTETLAAPVTLEAGVHYIAIMPVDTASSDIRIWRTKDYFIDDVAGEPVFEGTLTVTANTIPASIDPTAITQVGATLFVRLDN